MKTVTFSRFARLNKFGVLACLAGLLLFAAPQVRADDEDTTKDPPKRVARVSIVEGSVSLQPGGEGDWGSAAKNRPMTIGDKIWVDKDSRAELQAGEANFHLGSMTALSFLNLDEGITQVRIPEGAVNFRVRELRQGDVYEIDTPNTVFNVKQAGDFRIDVSEAGDSSRITVIRGGGEIAAGGKTYEVHAGEQAEFNGTEDNPTYSIMRAPGPDGLDKWAEERDLREDRSESGNYVSRDMPGYDDLDGHGTWSEQPDYGHVWYPDDVGPDWAPYSDGNWNWVDPWGWTWVGYEPWGFAPYHYGRWAFIGSRWGWCPGPFYGPPVYGPAFVGFLGGGFGFGFGVGFGVGWFPLGFGEPFFPWFHCGHEFRERINVRNTFIRNTNILNTTNVHNFNFVNAHNVNAVTVASHSAFVNGQAINRGAARLTAASLKGAQVTNSVGLSPNRHSAFGAVNAGAHITTPPSSIQNRSVMARTAPAAAASHMPVHTMNTTGLSAGRTGNSPANNTPANNLRVNSGMSARQNQLSQNRPPSANAGINNHSTFNATTNSATQNRPPSANAGVNNHSTFNATTNNAAQNRPSNGTRTWEAQGSTTDRGRAPQGFGRSSNGPVNSTVQGSGTVKGAGMTRSDRPPWAGSNSTGSASANTSGSPLRSPTYNANRPSYSNGSRSYEPPSRSYSAPSAPSRTYSAPRSYYPSSPRSYSTPSPSYSAPSRGYSAPSRSYSPPSYSAPSHSYSAPSHSYGGGGGYHGGGGGSPHASGGGGVSHGGGSHH